MFDPMVETKSRRVGGATYQVPVEVPEDRSISVGVSWLIDMPESEAAGAWKKSSQAEILDALANKGGAVKKREDTHKMAESNMTRTL